MRIPFKNLGQAELYLKTCSRHLVEYLKHTSTARLPAQRLRNAFCRGFGYGSYIELTRVLSTNPRDLKPIPSENEFKEVFSRAFLLAMGVAEEAGAGTVADHQTMAPFLADSVVKELKRTGSARDLYKQTPDEDADERLNRGWSIVQEIDMRVGSDLEQLAAAEAEFRQAVTANGDLADAYNGLAFIALKRGDFEEARRRSKTALDKAREALGSDAPGAYTWFGDDITRPYMRARHTLGLSLMRLGDARGAAREFKELLRRDSRDSHGVRFLIGPLHHQIGDMRHALTAYRRAAANGENTGDPHNEINYALALYESERFEESVLRFRYAFFRNLHIPQVLLGRPVRRLDIWYGSDLAEPEYAAAYKEEYGSLWEGKAGARAFLRSVYLHAIVQAEIEEYVGLGTRLAQTSDFKKRSPIVVEMSSLTALWRLKKNNPFITEGAAASVRKKPSPKK